MTLRIDFFIENKGNILPLEIKSGKDYNRHSALKNITNIKNYSIKESFILSNYNVKVDNKYIYYPIYMIMFIENDEIKLSNIKLNNLSFKK